MRLNVVHSKNAASLYVIESTYVGKKHSSRVVEKLGTEIELRKKLDGADPYEWARAYVAKLNKEDKEGKRVVKVSFDPTVQLSMGNRSLYNGGYLFLQCIYHSLKLNDVCREISGRYNFEYNLNAILSQLIYTRILYPSSKMSSYEAANRLLEKPTYALEDVYRALDVLAKESDFIQAQVYHNSKNVIERNSAILYYDCTNFFFEVEREDEVRQYGQSKEHRPNPIVEMGLFMDGNGIPLAVHITPGAKSEQLTLKPLEEQIIRDFSLSKFIVCTDAGLGSGTNRLLNDTKDRAFVVTQSLKKLEKSLMEWSLDPNGWRLAGASALYNLTEIDDTSDNPNIYYKARNMRSEIKQDHGTTAILEQKLIVSYSPKYKAYQRQIRAGQIERAQRMADNPSKLNRKKENDPARLLEQTYVTAEGEVAKRKKVCLSQAAIDKEAKFDGFYGVCTNRDEEIETIIRINKGRWEIEESFRILKTDFRSRPVYLSREERIKAHFLICFLGLLVYRILERKLGSKYTVCEIVKTLREMDFYEIPQEGYVPTYTRSPLTDDLHAVFGFQTDRRIVTKKKMALIQKHTRDARSLLKNVFV
jgi:transposase